MKKVITMLCLLVCLCITGLANAGERHCSLDKRGKVVCVQKKVRVTAYTSSKKENGGHTLTANNKKLRKGYIAVSRDLLKNGWSMGKKVYIEGMGIFEIQDKMHPRKKKSIDVYMASRKDAMDFGVQKLDVMLLDS